ncbi:hypothetical protein [Maricaulis maris]|uniref:hypothetical protein n=1 Tax=Maricaulis maris TaxID=74318 RepID=UPI003B8C3ACB
MISTPRTLLASLIALAAIAAPAAALQKGPSPAAPPSASADCDLVAAAPWGDDADSGLVAEAVTICGEDGRIRATLSLVDDKGETRFQRVFPTDEVMLLAWAEPGQMDAALTDWLGAFTHLDTTANIPGPDAEFPFYAAEGVTDAEIDTLREEAREMACIVQGLESALCLVREGEGVREVGVWLFPG